VTRKNYFKKFYSCLTLDNKVEFFSYKPMIKKDGKNFIDEVWPQRKRSNGKEDIQALE